MYEKREEKNMKIVLASASPRRKELLGQMGLTFEVIPSDADENVTAANPAALVEELSRRKAYDVAQKDNRDGVLYIGSDTLVAYKGQVLGKPADEAQAKDMLYLLQGNVHQVYTGVTFIWTVCGEQKTVTFSEKTDVKFYPMSEDEIMTYLAAKESMDKAGAYGIQGRSAVYIEKIDGDYNNVVGLPIARLYQELKKYGIWSEL